MTGVNDSPITDLLAKSKAIRATSAELRDISVGTRRLAAEAIRRSREDWHLTLRSPVDTKRSVAQRNPAG